MNATNSNARLAAEHGYNDDAAVIANEPSDNHGPTGPEEVLTLELADLLGDSNGEIVLFNDSHLPAVAVRATHAPIGSGAVDKHITATGADVTGYRYVAFDNGTKLYYHDSLDLFILDAYGTAHG
jgi:hypothetical protein